MNLTKSIEPHVTTFCLWTNAEAIFSFADFRRDDF